MRTLVGGDLGTDLLSAGASVERTSRPSVVSQFAAGSRGWPSFRTSVPRWICTLTHYNFVRFHGTIRCTPAMEAGSASSPMTIEDLVDMAA